MIPLDISEALLDLHIAGPLYITGICYSPVITRDHYFSTNSVLLYCYLGTPVEWMLIIGLYVSNPSAIRQGIVNYN